MVYPKFFLTIQQTYKNIFTFQKNYIVFFTLKCYHIANQPTLSDIHSFLQFKLKLFSTTLTELHAIAALAIIGFNKIP